MIQKSVLSSGKIVYFKILSEYCYYKDSIRYVTPPNFISSSYYKTIFFSGGGGEVPTYNLRSWKKTFLERKNEITSSLSDFDNCSLSSFFLDGGGGIPPPRSTQHLILAWGHCTSSLTSSHMREARECTHRPHRK